MFPVDPTFESMIKPLKGTLGRNDLKSQKDIAWEMFSWGSQKRTLERNGLVCSDVIKGWEVLLLMLRSVVDIIYSENLS